MKILVVDDSEQNRKLLKVLLEAESFEVVAAADGEEALIVLNRTTVDAIISDILMPRMDGYRLCHEVRKSAKFNAVPFIVYTATYTSPADEKLALNFGADKFLRKPASPADIISALQEVMKEAIGYSGKELQEPQELLAMREYSEVLVRKLEENNLELAEANKSLEERTVLAEFNGEIADALSHKGTLREILRLCTEAMVHYLDAAFARIWTYNKKTHVLELQASAGIYTHINGGHARVPIGQFKIGLIASEQKPHLTNSVIGDPRVHDQEWAKREGMVAFAGYPLIVEEQLVGVMAMFARKPLSANSIKAMESVAKSVATGVERKWAEEERQKNLDRIRALHEIDCAITSTLDLHTILDVLLEKISRLFPIPSVTTVRLLNQNGELEPTACWNIDREEWQATISRKPGVLTEIVLTNRAPVIIGNLWTDPRTDHMEFFRKHHLVSYLGIPLVAQDRIVGILGIFTQDQHDFSDDEVEFLLTIAGRAAIALHKSQLYEEIKSSRSQLESANQRLDKTLKELSHFYAALTPLAPAESVEQLMDAIIERLMEATGADAALIRLWDMKASAYPIAGHRGFADEYLERVETVPSEGAVEWVVKHGEPIIAPDIASEPRFKGKVQLALGFRSCAMLPLTVNNEVRGVIHVSSRNPGYFDEEQSDHLSAVARQMSIALENRELFFNLKSSRDELEASNRVKSEFLSVMSHELRTPLNVIIGYAALIEEDLVREADEPQRHSLQKIESEADSMLAMINQIMEASQIQSGTIGVVKQPVNIAQLFQQLIAAYEFLKKKDLVLIWQASGDLPVLMTDREKLKQILRNLINNAVKFTENGTVTVSATLADSQRQSAWHGHTRPSAFGSEPFIEFKVSDTGIGIPEESLPVIFDRFKQVDSSATRAYEGVGLGLFIAKKYSELLGGQVDVESTEGRGSTFTVRIPCNA